MVGVSNMQKMKHRTLRNRIGNNPVYY